MALKVSTVDVWAGEMTDQPGGLARILEAIAAARGTIECVIARRQPDKPGTGVAFISPVKGTKVQQAARGAGLVPAENIATLRIEGDDKPGMGAKITRAIADAGINVRGVSAAVIGKKYVVYIGLDNAADANAAAKAVKAAAKRK